jgi:AraC-like DNA-binding protein
MGRLVTVNLWQYHFYATYPPKPVLFHYSSQDMHCRKFPAAVTYRIMFKEQYSSSASWLQAAEHVLNQAGVDGAAVLARSNIRVSDYGAAGRRAPTRVIRRAWTIVAEYTRDPAIGVRAAQQYFQPADWQSLGLAILCSNTLRQALERLNKYFQMVSDAADTLLVEDKSTLRFVATPFDDPEELGYEAIEYGLAALISLLQEIYPRPLHPLRIDLLRPEKFSSPEFARLFNCPVTFGCEREALVFSLADVDLPLHGSNDVLAQYQDSFSDEYLARFGNDSISLKVKREILRSLPGGNPCQVSVADALHMSVRNLQRQLGSENTSFRQLVTDIRQQLSCTYLRQESRSFGEIAYVLGFSDHSNFSRAFKQWFAITPSEYRAHMDNSDLQ